MPTTKKSEFPKKRRTKSAGPAINIKGDAKDSNIVIGDRNVIDQSTKTTNIFKNTSPKQLFLYGFLVVMVVSVIGWLGYYNLLRYDRTIVSGQLNVLVIPFVEEKAWGYVKSDLGWSVAQILADGTQSAFASTGSTVNIKILGPAERVPQILYQFTEEGLNQEAENISEEINAQIVIYGVVTEDEYGDKIVTTKIYISPSNFGEAQELISDSIMGELSLGSIRLTSDTANATDLLAQNKELRDRLEIFSSIINFLGAYVGEDFDRADEYITQAEDASLWSNANGLEVIYLMHGNMKIRQARVMMINKDLEATLETIEQAKENFKESSNISNNNGKGQYARAYLGLAGAESLLAITKANIEQDAGFIDLAALDRSLEYLSEAQAAEYQPETADVMVKVNYGKAQVALGYFAKTGNSQYLEDAKANYQLVVDEYEKTRNQRISEFAALSHSGLGQIAKLNQEFETAVDHFMSAQEITVNPSLKVQALANVGDIYFENNEYELALKYYEDVLSRRNDLQKAFSSERIIQIEERIEFIKNGASS